MGFANARGALLLLIGYFSLLQEQLPAVEAVRVKTRTGGAVAAHKNKHTFLHAQENLQTFGVQVGKQVPYQPPSQLSAHFPHSVKAILERHFAVNEDKFLVYFYSFLSFYVVAALFVFLFLFKQSGHLKDREFLPRDGFSDGICDWWTSSIRITLQAFCFPCCRHQQTLNAVGMGPLMFVVWLFCILIDLFLFFPLGVVILSGFGAYYRYRLREIYRLPKQHVLDWVAWCFCIPLAVAQEARHVERAEFLYSNLGEGISPTVSMMKAGSMTGTGGLFFEDDKATNSKEQLFSENLDQATVGENNAETTVVAEQEDKAEQA